MLDLGAYFICLCTRVMWKLVSESLLYFYSLHSHVILLKQGLWHRTLSLPQTPTFENRVYLYSPGCLGTWDPPASVSPVSGITGIRTTSSCISQTMWQFRKPQPETPTCSISAAAVYRKYYLRSGFLFFCIIYLPISWKFHIRHPDLIHFPVLPGPCAPPHTYDRP